MGATVGKMRGELAAFAVLRYADHADTVPVFRPSMNGVNYVHSRTLSDGEDSRGFLIELAEGGQ